MPNTVGDRWPGRTVAERADRRAEFVPRQRVAALPDRRPARPGCGGTAATMVVLVADPRAESRERLAAAMIAAGAARVVQADTVAAVDALVADGSGGQLALVSLAFGASTSRLITGLTDVPWSRVVALALSSDPAPLLAAIDAGATGVLRGTAGRVDPPPVLLGQLTPREVEVLRLVADGRSNKSIAESLSLSALTVKSHLSRIGRKLGTGDRSHQVAVAMRAGVLR